MIRRFFSQAWLYHKGRTSAFKLSEFLAFDIGNPMLTMVFYCLLAAYGFRTMDLTHWVISNAFLLCTNTCIFGLGGLFRGERMSGRLRSIVASPYSKLAVVLASGVGPALISLLTVLFNLVVGSLLFRIDFSDVSIGMTVLVILCAMISATCFGLFIAVFGLLTSSIHLVLNILNFVLIIFTGAEFPVSQLPVLGQLLSQCLPLTRTIRAMDVLFGQTGGKMKELLIGELVLAVIYLFLARALLYLVERLCRVDGKLDAF